MVFSSPVFLFAYLPLTLAVYYLMPLRWRNLALFLLSLVFYGWDKPIYIPVMLFSVTVSYLCGFPIGKYRDRDRHRARVWLVVSLVLNLSVLVFFKYTNFIIENLRLIPPLAGVLHPLEWLELPIGISFYTFQIMSYSIDLYRGENETQRSYIAFGTYVALFPQLIAGPIVRYRDVDRQLLSRTHTVDRFASGVRRFAVGFGKKILLGDALAAVYAYLSTAADFEFTVLSGWLMVATYTLHIYFDFSGYSDMAIGLGRMFGFEFPENFRYPYMASSITDFWRRWHITLSTWFREYLYIPLGGNRKGKGRQLLNILLVWLATGLWHGADWTFVLWGLLYAALLTAEKLFLLRGLKKLRVLNHIYVLLFVTLGFVLFDADSVRSAAASVCAMFGGGGLPLAGQESLYALRSGAVLLLSAAVGATPLPRRLITAVQQKTAGRAVLAVLEPVGLCLLLAVCTAFLVDGSFNPFLYFRF